MYVLWYLLMMWYLWLSWWGGIIRRLFKVKVVLMIKIVCLTPYYRHVAAERTSCSR